MRFLNFLYEQELKFLGVQFKNHGDGYYSKKPKLSKYGSVVFAKWQVFINQIQ